MNSKKISGQSQSVFNKIKSKQFKRESQSVKKGGAVVSVSEVCGYMNGLMIVRLNIFWLCCKSSVKRMSLSDSIAAAIIIES